MSTRLYEELGITEDATPEQVRKAYRKKALLTHPDRLPQGATDEQKAISEEQFKRVNNAYEVLIDPTKRQEYDNHGIWPPPDESQRSPPAQAFESNFGQWPPSNNIFPDPFMSHRTGLPRFHFSDPFSLFEQIFAGTPFARSSRHRHPFFNQPFGHNLSDIDDLLNEMDGDPFASRGFSGFSGFPTFPQFPGFPPIMSSVFSGGNGRWVSESYSNSTINGVTQSFHKRIDTEGNEHVTRTLPDGRKIRTINGVEQPAQQHITYPQTNQNHHLLQSLPQPYPQRSPVPQFVPNDPRSYPASGPPLYPTHQSQGYQGWADGHDHPSHHHHSRRDNHRRPSEHA